MVQSPPASVDTDSIQAWSIVKNSTKRIITSSIDSSNLNTSRIVVWQYGNDTQLMLDSVLMENSTMEDILLAVDAMQAQESSASNLSLALNIAGQEMVNYNESQIYNKSSMVVLTSESSTDSQAGQEAAELHTAGIEISLVTIGTSQAPPTVSAELYAVASVPIESHLVVCGGYVELEGAALTVASQIQTSKSWRL